MFLLQVRTLVIFPNGLDMENIFICQDTWEGSSKVVYTIVSSCAQFLLPFTVVIAIYLSIFFKLRNRPRVSKTTSLNWTFLPSFNESEKRPLWAKWIMVMWVEPRYVLNWAKVWAWNLPTFVHGVIPAREEYCQLHAKSAFPKTIVALDILLKALTWTHKNPQQSRAKMESSIREGKHFSKLSLSW